MADSIKASSSLSVGIEYTDNGNRKIAYLSVPDPKDELTENEIKQQVGTAINTGVFLIDDGTSEQTISADQIFTAYTTDQTINDIDIGVE